MAGLRLTLLLRACGWRGVAEREEVMIFFFKFILFKVQFGAFSGARVC